jgi:hypothetical protein
MENYNTKWNSDCDRFIAFMDIKGFKDYVARENHLKIKEKLIELKKRTNWINEENILFNCDAKLINFSDSICIFTSGITNEDFEFICYASREVLRNAIELNIPIMGAISMGMLTVDIENQIYFGQPLIDAYNLSEELGYYGVVLDCKVHKFLQSYEIKDKTFFLGKTTFKKGEVYHYNLNLGIFFDLNIMDFEKRLNEFYYTVSGVRRKFVDNTIQMYKSMQKEISIVTK